MIRKYKEQRNYLLNSMNDSLINMAKFIIESDKKHVLDISGEDLK